MFTLNKWEKKFTYVNSTKVYLNFPYHLSLFLSQGPLSG